MTTISLHTIRSIIKREYPDLYDEYSDMTKKLVERMEIETKNSR